MPTKIFLQSTRLSSFKSSLFVEDVGEVKRKYEVTYNPTDWKYVERILPLSVVPEPKKKDNYTSGWKRQADNLQNRPYFIERTKNHMIPVYLKISQRGIRRETIVKKIQGDIWLLEKELRTFWSPKHQKL
ncbi:hypothetical protein NQ317_012638 [Molorchus minor]|uniref:Large ribosomal subunit protein mL49 n=1 Tax=Molorchus minor TaxID=1323400 RepID=A0ABQ9IR17_9CUCU|nr:hypothetical protein NQ317_012638 [Molorchus minor]